MKQQAQDFAQLQQALRQSHPALQLEIRGPIDGGLSGAEVLFVDYVNQGQHRHGVVKVVSAKNASKEQEGDKKARASWLAQYLPTHFEVLSPLPDTGKIPLLFSLAKDRSDNCQTLLVTLQESYPYACNHVLFAIGWAYRTVASPLWATSKLTSFKDVYLEPLRLGLSPDWLSAWESVGLPGADKGTIIFEGLSERWPNPVAFALREDMWPDEKSLRVRVPWLTSHGDFNTRNVLCPGIQRAIALEIAPRSPIPKLLLPHLSFIDTPFCRDLPFPYDIAFLTASVRVLLGGFASRAGRDNAIRAFRALLDEVCTGAKQVNVSADSHRFVACASVLWDQLRFTQEKMAEDIQSAYLATLASACLWQAIKACRGARESAISALCLSALALRQLLGKHGEHLAGPDYELWTNGPPPSGTAWTVAASAISTLLRQSAGRRVFVLIVGQDCSKLFGLPTEMELPELRKASPEAILAAMEPTLGAASAVANLGKAPFAAVFDWSAFPYPRRAIASQIPAPAFLSAHFRGGAEPDWGARDCIFYFHLRGTLENGTLALTAPERSRSRRELKQAIGQFRKKKTGELTAVYVAVSDVELRESNDYLQEMWNERSRGVYIGPDDGSLTPYLEEWKIDRIDGTIVDLVAACSDLSAPGIASATTESQTHVVTVADMSRDKYGSLIASPGSRLSISVLDADHDAITRAGEFLYQSNLGALSTLKRDPKEYFIGHRVTLDEVALGVPIEREVFASYYEAATAKLADKYPQTLVLPSRPGAGASTALRLLAFRFAYDLNIPTLVLTCGGTVAFEAIERIQRVVGRSFLVVADPQDVPSDETRALQTRCAPARYPALLLTSVRSTLSGAKFTLPVLPIELSTKEKIDWLQRLGRYCPTVDLGQLMRSTTRSMFFLSLEAFGGSNVRVNPMVEELLGQATPDQAFLLASVAFFSRFTHRHCSDAFLEVLTGASATITNEKLEPYDQLLVLRERDGWACRHEDLTKAILQFHLAQRFTEDYRHSLAEFATSIIGNFSDDEAGADIGADYVWAMINPQLEAQRTAAGDKVPQSRLLDGEDGVTQDAMRRNIYAAAEKSFPSHVNVVSHFGKFLSEVEKKYAEAEHYLMRAHELGEHNEAVMHMLGKRYFDELRGLIRANPPDAN